MASNTKIYDIGIQSFFLYYYHQRTMWTITTVNRCDHPKEGGVQQRLSEFTQRPPQNYTCGGPRRSHPRDTPGWTAHHFGAGHKQAEARPWTLVPAPPPSGQHPPTWRPVFARRPGPRGASAAGPNIPMVGTTGQDSPPKPRRTWVKNGLLPACNPGAPHGPPAAPGAKS